MNFKKLLIGTLFLGMCGGALANYNYLATLMNTSTASIDIMIVAANNTILSNADGSGTTFIVHPSSTGKRFKFSSSTQLYSTDQLMITSAMNSNATPISLVWELEQVPSVRASSRSSAPETTSANAAVTLINTTPINVAPLAPSATQK